MTKIQKIKDDLTKISKWPWKGENSPIYRGVVTNEDWDFIFDCPERISLLVEYYEAAEAEFKYVGISGDTETYRRLQKARKELEAEE